MITGETGVGKELVAQRLHDLSARADKPFITVNCAALPEHLVESELFGHVKGAFSGAIENRLGKFEVASTGTLFLDEIGELPLAVQATLLRVLQGGQLLPLTE
ncbi:Anaerobic nitric oxide reductase transcription regulator, partial [Pseudomonas savastanoi pv. nerii]